MVRLTRVITYEYETVEDMAKDIPNWSLPNREWFPFNGAKRARSRVTEVSGDEGFDHNLVSKVLADSLAKTPRVRARRGGQ